VTLIVTLLVQVIALVPPEQGTPDHPEWKRYSLEDEHTPGELSLYVSRYGVFAQDVEFPQGPGSWLVRLICFSFKWTLQLLLQMAKGVVVCHQADVVHCDLVRSGVVFPWGPECASLCLWPAQLTVLAASCCPASHVNATQCTALCIMSGRSSDPSTCISMDSVPRVQHCDDWCRSPGTSCLTRMAE
jgi:hypothetical protein